MAAYAPLRHTKMIGSKKKVVDAFKEEKFAALWGHFLGFSENLKSGHFVLQISPYKSVYKKKMENTMTKPTENSSK